MTAPLRGFMAQNDRLPRGERVAAWVEDHMRLTGSGVGEVAFRIRADKRDVRRLLADRSCGPRLEDALAAYFGWPFIESVFTPVVGSDPLTALERELEARLAQAAAVHERLEKERGLRTPASAVDRNKAGEAAVRSASARGGCLEEDHGAHP